MKSLIEFFKIFSTVFFIFLVAGFFLPAFAAERYQLNANEWIGYIDIIFEGESVSGNGLFNADPRGRPTRQRFEIREGRIERIGRDGVKIVFRRSDSEQYYYGWFSVDKNLIAGYFNHGDGQYGWFATKEKRY